MKEQEEQFKKVPPHRHCASCGLMIPNYQYLCNNCTDEEMIKRSEPRKPYYISEIDEILGKPSNVTKNTKEVKK